MESLLRLTDCGLGNKYYEKGGNFARIYGTNRWKLDTSHHDMFMSVLSEIPFPSLPPGSLEQLVQVPDRDGGGREPGDGRDHGDGV